MGELHNQRASLLRTKDRVSDEQYVLVPEVRICKCICIRVFNNLGKIIVQTLTNFLVFNVIKFYQVFYCGLEQVVQYNSL